jgi:hypothetical protein
MSVRYCTEPEPVNGARCRMSDTTVATAMADESARWAAWVARGVEQDRKAHRYTVAFVATVAVVLAASLAMVLAAR